MLKTILWGGTISLWGITYRVLHLRISPNPLPDLWLQLLKCHCVNLPRIYIHSSRAIFARESHHHSAKSANFYFIKGKGVHAGLYKYPGRWSDDQQGRRSSAVKDPFQHSARACVYMYFYWHLITNAWRHANWPDYQRTQQSRRIGMNLFISHKSILRTRRLSKLHCASGTAAV